MRTKKGWLQNLKTEEVVAFQYNPTTTEYGRSARYTDIVAPGVPYPTTQYVGGDSSNFNLELYFNDEATTPTSTSIEDFLTFINDLMPPESNRVVGRQTPPKVLVSYGSFIKVCVLTGYSYNSLQKNAELEDIEVTLTLNLRQVK